uniref:phosphoribosylglycinamide formyltransferase 1 n=1 Tax=Kwoniella dejecticola CBS 10117 TaxID=1296121 RepID=A0A1A6AGH2_9TREE|nr:phosphoribosylglycinamide formyltransferase [Kwoniella dejecticola CBS 10117]OBR89151.1 phosphoribosylglycinamide formyltransferase [Kwoniella dejecticola CBS 10117]
MPTLHETIIPSKRVRRITVLISGSGSNLQALLDSASTPSLPNCAISYVISSRSNAYGLTRAKTHIPSIPTKVCALKTFQNRNPGSTREDYDCEVARLILESKPDLVVLAGWMHILSDKFLRILNGEIEPPSEPALPPPALGSASTSTPSESQNQSQPQKNQSQGTELPDLKDLKISAENSEQESPKPKSEAPAQAQAKPSDNVEAAADSTQDSKPDTSPAPKKLPEPPMHQSFPIPIINLHPALPGQFDGANAIGRAYEAFGKGEITHTGVMVHRVVAEVDRGEPLVVRQVEIREGDKLEDLESRIHEVSATNNLNGQETSLDL